MAISFQSTKKKMLLLHSTASNLNDTNSKQFHQWLYYPTPRSTDEIQGSDFCCLKSTVINRGLKQTKKQQWTIYSNLYVSLILWLRYSYQ